MAEELQVVVQQEVGVISWNFEQLKTALAEKMQEYEGLVYTEDNVKTAKTDVAALRKIRKAISDKRIEVKKMCLEPYEAFEAQAGELTELIDKPINQIDVQLNEYEENRRAAVREKILAYFDEYGKNLHVKILATVKERKYDNKWENATTATKRWKQGVEDVVRAAERDIKWIEESVEQEFWEESLEAYSKHLELSEVMTEVTKLRKQKEAILSREKARMEAEARAKAEAEVKARLEAEKEPPKQEPETGKTEMPDTHSNEREHTNLAIEIVDVRDIQPQTPIAQKGCSSTSEGDTAEIYTFRIKATKQQIAKIKGYIEYSGAAYREV